MPDTLFYRPGCIHCDNILALVRRRPRLRHRLVLRNVKDVSQQVDAVPTIVLADGSRLVGGQAFNFVNSFPEETSSTDRLVRLSLIGAVLYAVYRMYKQQP